MLKLNTVIPSLTPIDFPFIAILQRISRLRKVPDANSIVSVKRLTKESTIKQVKSRVVKHISLMS